MITISGYDYTPPQRPKQVTLDVEAYKQNPLWYHKRGLMQTSTGYGRKLTTEHMIRIGKRWHRVYCCLFSNSGTNFIVKDGKEIVIDIEDVIN